MSKKKKLLSKKPVSFIKISLNIDHFKHLEFLDLEYSAKNNNRIFFENFKFCCRFEKGFGHILHSENNHLNSLTDLVLSLGFSAEKEKINIQKILVNLTQENSERNNNINNIIKNLEFIKDQNNCIINCLKGKIKITENSESFYFSKELEDLTKTIKDLKLNPTEDPKKELNPPIYKHWKPRK